MLVVYPSILSIILGLFMISFLFRHLLICSAMIFTVSLDGLLFKRKRNAHIPLWNYTVFRFQVGNSSNIKSHRTHQIQWMHQSLC